MASFKKNSINSTSSVLARQKSKPIIYVEGQSDKSIYENFWFVELLGKVSFSITPNTQGCSAVVKTVASDRSKGIVAFGIVDRDKLMTDGNWNLLRQTDDSLFDSSWPYPEVKITRRWELESYLIEPEVLEAYLAPAQGGRLPRSMSVVEAELLAHADALVPFAALNQALHLHNIPAPKDGYTLLDSRTEVQIRIPKEKLVSHPQISGDYHSNLPLVDAFVSSTAITPRQRLQGLLRTVNGKAMLDRVKRAAQLKDDITYLIAKEMKQLKRVPAEIDSFVRQCCI